jgi:hypothetical protein
MIDWDRARDIASVVKDVATAVALVWASIWAAIRFGWLREHRQSQEAAKITLTPSHSWLGTSVVLYLTVQIESLGSSDIRAERADLAVQWLSGGTNLGPPAEFSRQFAHDPRSIYLVDKGESMTFSFVAEHPFQQDRPTAVRLLFTFASHHPLENGEYLSWAREEIHLLSAP